MAVIPAICEGCGNVWITKNSFIGGIAPGAVVRLTGNRVGHCPDCGRMGRIPDGNYTSISMDLFDRNQWEAIIQALTPFRIKLKADPTQEEIAREIHGNPVLSYFKKFLPQNPQDVAAYVGIVLAIAIYCRGCGDTGTTGTIDVPPEAKAILSEIAEHEGQ